VTGTTATSVTVQWAAGDVDSFDVDLTAFNDTLLDTNQSLTLSLTGAAVTAGAATIPAADESATLTIIDTDAPPPNILDGVMKTNTNQTNQFITLGWVDQDDPRFASAKIYDLNLQGQQGTVLQDVGFDINPNAGSNYLATFEASSGTKAIVTDLSLEGVLIQGSGNAQLQLDNTSATNSTSTAFTAVINPDDTTTPTYDGVSLQGKLLSTDGDELTNLLSADNDFTTVDYIYGAGGNDTLTGTAGSEILNGGAGLDTLNGAGGNDILVYDNVNNDAIDGGAGFDLLRIDDGALALSLAGSSINSNTLDSGDNVTVNLSGKNIHNIEGVLITEEAGASTSGIDPNDDVGTTLVITAQDVFDYTDSDHVLYVLGNPGDKLDIDLGQWSTDNTVNADGFIAYTATVNSTTVTLMIEDTTQITVV
jgi:Ca2+-binding RTX toxin-like protein